jgi:hypothetical protein
LLRECDIENNSCLLLFGAAAKRRTALICWARREIDLGLVKNGRIFIQIDFWFSVVVLLIE